MKKLLIVSLLLLSGQAMANSDWMHQQNVQRELEKIERHLNDIATERYRVNPGPAKGKPYLNR